MTVYETDIPGVGHKFELELDGGARAIVLVHHDGRREVFRRPEPDADSERVFDLGTAQARAFAAMLQGTGFETVDVAALEVPLGDAIIEWVTVPEDSPLAGRTLGDCDIRGETGASVIAIQRDDETIANPDRDFVVAVADILVSLGSRTEQAALQTLAEPG